MLLHYLLHLMLTTCDLFRAVSTDRHTAVLKRLLPSRAQSEGKGG
jgi:hypothetical protein